MSVLAWASAVIDPAGGFGYFGTDSGVVVKVRLSDFTRTMTFAAGETSKSFSVAMVLIQTKTPA